MRLLVVLSFLALLGPALSTETAAVPASARADPRDPREYIGKEGEGDRSVAFVAECLAQMVTGGIPELWHPLFQGMVDDCVARGQKAGLAMKVPYSSDWARWVDFEIFFHCLARYMLKKTNFYGMPLRDNDLQARKQRHARSVARGLDSCQGTLPATIVHRPTLPVHEGAPVAEHGTSGPLQFRHQATRRAGLHPLAWMRRLGPELLRAMRPAVQRAEATLERRPRVMEY
ncbi:MAG: hypothetical protein M1826_004552 [Phylliscum demangeonii]|nr:MAG: hypothetical protein M1826_004552 [Phylliscum demangeonii]